LTLEIIADLNAKGASQAFLSIFYTAWRAATYSDKDILGGINIF